MHNYSSMIKVWEKHVAAHLVSACLLETDKAKSLFANMIASIQ